jgi:hypothetical protein
VTAPTVTCRWSIIGGWLVEATGVEVQSGMYNCRMLLPTEERELAHTLGAAQDLLAAAQSVDRDIEAQGVVTAESIETLRLALAKARTA